MTVPAQAYPEASQSTTILVLGILSIVCCGALGIAAWVMGNSEIQAIDEGRRPPHNRSTANIGKVLGMVGIGLWLLGAVLSMTGALVLPFAGLN